MTRLPVITIDGPAGAGKSTVARLLAKRISCRYLDTGALYRAIGYRLIQQGWDEDLLILPRLCDAMAIRLEEGCGTFAIFVDDEDVTDKIRTERIALLASKISAVPEVRNKLMDVQRDAAARGGIVAEGRDMGTVVFPKADVKFFLDADASERATRRILELQEKGNCPDPKEIKKAMRLRDNLDRERKIAPLIVPPDAIVIDSTHKSISDVVETMYRYAEKVRSVQMLHQDLEC